MQKTGIIVTLVLVVLIAAGGFIYSSISYKFCFGCDAAGFYSRGLEYACSNKKNHRQIGLEFIQNAADQGLLKAELTLAEIFSDSLPADYTFSPGEQRECFRQVVTPDQSTGISYFEAALTSIKKDEPVDPTVLDNLALLYSTGVLSAEDHADEAVKLYKKSAAEGSFSAMVQLGLLADARAEYQEALQWFMQASDNPQDASSPLMVADYFRYGRGTDQNYIKAKEWYSKSLARAAKDLSKDSDKLANTATARLDMVKRKLDENRGKEQVSINYRLEGGVKHFIIFAADLPGQPLGEVINNNGTITAIMNEKLELSQQLPEPARENFSSMNEGMRWVLNTYAKNTKPDTSGMLFNFVLTKS